MLSRNHSQRFNTTFNAHQINCWVVCFNWNAGKVVIDGTQATYICLFVQKIRKKTLKIRRTNTHEHSTQPRVDRLSEALAHEVHAVRTGCHVNAVFISAEWHVAESVRLRVN